MHTRKCVSFKCAWDYRGFVLCMYSRKFHLIVFIFKKFLHYRLNNLLKKRPIYIFIQEASKSSSKLKEIVFHISTQCVTYSMCKLNPHIEKSFYHKVVY